MHNNALLSFVSYVTHDFKSRFIKSVVKRNPTSISAMVVVVVRESGRTREELEGGKRVWEKRQKKCKKVVVVVGSWRKA
jgi:hypothetical protein